MEVSPPEESKGAESLLETPETPKRESEVDVPRAERGTYSIISKHQLTHEGQQGISSWGKATQAKNT